MGGRDSVHEGARCRGAGEHGKVEAARNAFVKAHQQQILKVLSVVTKMVEIGDYHLPNGVKDALLKKWQDMKEDFDADTDADTDAADADDKTSDDKPSYAAQTQRRTLR